MVADFIEHRAYLPMVGFIILILEIWPAKNLDIRKQPHLAVAASILLLFASITFIYAKNFKNRLTFWENAAKNSPHFPLVHRNLGAMYYLDGFPDKAEAEYRKALALNPREEMAHNNLGLIYMNRNMFKEAEEEYRKELEINPFYDNACFNLGLLYYKEGKLIEAAELWQRTIEINPDYLDAYRNLAAYYYGQNDLSSYLYYSGQLKKRGGMNPR